MKKFYFLAVSALVFILAACGPKVIEKKFANTNFATFTTEGTGKYGAKNCLTGDILIPAEYSNIGYYYSGYFTAQDANGICLYDTLKNKVIPASNEINAHEGYFDFATDKSSKGEGSKGIYFIKEKTTVSGCYEALQIDEAGNVIATATVGETKVCGVLSPKNSIIIPCEYNLLILEADKYYAAKDKNPKRPFITNKDGKISVNWVLAEASVFDKDGKLIKKLTAAQAKKIFEAKK